MTQAFNISMVLRADATPAKAGLTDVTTALKKLADESDKAGARSKMQASEMERLAKATAIAANSQNELANAEHRAAEARQRIAATPLNVLANPAGNQVSIMDSVVANMTTGAARASVAWRGVETSIVSAQQAIMGLNNTIGTQAHEMAAAAQASALYQRQLDDIRASFSPLFGALVQYERQLDRIDTAVRSHIITEREAADARQAAARQLQSTRNGGPGPGFGAGSFYTGNIMAQGFDVGVTAAMGMNPGMIGLQQGTQFAQVVQSMGGGMTAIRGIGTGLLAILSPLNLVTIGFTALAAVGIQALMKLMPITKSTAEVLGEMADSVTRVKDATSAARVSMFDLAKEFGSNAAEAKKLLELMTEIELRTATKKTDAALENIYSELGGAWNYSGGRRDYLQRMLGERSLAGRFMATPENSPQTFKVDSALGDFEAARTSEDIDKQIEAANRLLYVFDAAAKASGKVTDEENTWLGQIGELIKGLERIKALKENAAGKTEAKAITHSYAQQVELARASLVFGESSAEVAAVRNLHEQEALRLKLDGLGLSAKNAEYTDAMNGLLAVQLERERALVAERLEQARARQDAIEALRREQQLLGATTAEQIRAKAIAEADIQIRKEKLGFLDAILLKTDAIAKAEAEIALSRAKASRELETSAMMDQYDLRAGLARDPRIRADIEAEREMTRQLRDGTDPALARASADRVRTAALNDLVLTQDRYLQDQQRSMQQMQLELALIGQSEEVRRRVLALAEAERQIAETGASGEVAERIRAGAAAQAETALALEAQVSAWKRVQSAGEGAIDSVLDKLRKGDAKGALADFIGEIEKGFFDLAIRNPLKNAIFGSNLGTWDDVGGWSGVWDRLTGKSKVDEAGLARTAAMTTPSMMVTAANVTLSGNLAGLGTLTGTANLNAAPMPGFAAGSLGGSKDVQAQVWQYFAAKGMAPHHIAGIMGNIQAESGFNPVIPGDNGNAVGLFQHNGPRMRGLLNSIGGAGNLGNVQAQLDYVWQELMTTERPAYNRLIAQPDARSAANAFMHGFERPSQESRITSGPARENAAAAAEAAFSQMTQAAQTASIGVGQLGSGATRAGAGMDNLGEGMGQLGGGMGQLLAGIAGSVGGKAGGWLSALVSIGTQLGDGVPLYNTGGFTGGSDPNRAAGIVHEGEYVFDAAATRRIGLANLEGIRKGGMRGFRDGGFVGISPSTAQNTNAPVAMAGRQAEEVNFNIDLSGARGDKEIMEGVRSTVRAALEEYNDRALPGRVRGIMRDMRAS